ncbi:MAG: hypothetical protein JNK53_05510, partial [Phycisphaerae bacterium]|nr:hypothetical protein [Phycisphaerae bacterium]
QCQDASIANAQHLKVADGARLSADATVSGDGGTIAFRSDRRTDFFGRATARGAGANGAGGFIEASGKLDLQYDGQTNLLGSGTGPNGTLLLDPGFLLVLNVAGGVNTIGLNTINAALASGNVVVQNAGVDQSDGIRWLASNSISGLNTSSLKLNAIGPGAGVEFVIAPSFGSWLGTFSVETKTGPITVGTGLNRPLGGAIVLKAGGGAAIALNGSSVSSFNSPISFIGPVTLGANTTVISGTGPVLFSSTVTGVGGARNLTVNSSGLTTFTGSLSSIGRLITDAGGTTTFGGDLGLSGNSAINDPSTFLAGPHALTNTGNFSTYFGGTVNGPGSLNVTHGSGALTFGNLIASVSNLGGLTVNSAGSVTFSGGVDGPFALSVNTTGSTDFLGGVGTLVPLASLDVLTGMTKVIGGTVVTSGNQSYQKVMLGNHAIFDGANITIGDALGRTGGGLRNVTMVCPGVVTMNGAVGNINNFTSDAGGTIVVGGPMTLTGLLSIDDAMQLNAPLVNLSATNGINLFTVAGGGNSLLLRTPGVRNLNGNLTGLMDFSTNSAGSTMLGANLTAAGTVDIQSTLTVSGVGQTRTITALGAGDVLMKKTVDGPASLDIFAGTGDVAFGNAVGGTMALGGLHINTSGTVGFTSTINGAMDLVVNSGGLTTFGGSVGQSSALNLIDVSGPAHIGKGGLMTTTGGQDYGNLTLGTNSVLTSLGGADIDFNGTVNGNRNLTVTTAGDTNFNGLVGNATALRVITVTNDVNFNAASVASTDDQSYGNATLNSNVAITAGSGDVAFNGLVDGARDLSVTTSGMTTLGGAVGGSTALTSLNIAGRSALNGGTVDTTGTQVYGGNATLGADTVLTSTGGADVRFGGTLNGARNLTVATGGAAQFDGLVGGGTALTSLTALGNVNMNGGGVRTTGAQAYGDMSLGADALLQSTAAGAIGLNGTVNGARNLTATTAGTTTLGGVVGSGTALTSLTITNGAALNGGSVTTTGAQSFGASVLGSDTTLSSTGGGDITFTGTLNGAQALATNTLGTTRFLGAVGGGTALSQLAVNGATAINGGVVNTSGFQVFGNTTLGAATNLTSTAAGDISLGSVSGGGNFLGVHTLGNTNFNGNVTGVSGLLADGGGTTTLGGNIVSTGDVALMDSVMLVVGAHGVSSSLGDVMFGGAVNGPGSLTAGAAGTTTFAGPVGSTLALASLLVNGNSSFGGGAVTTTGAMNIAGPSTFTADTTLTSGGLLTLGANA